ncbi:Ribosomal RNA-processing protein 7-like A [Hondaea fermentalgiana]|uniref:Ribosomal RNA-processing protein 7-like A n=1 Tax=Hondaea fermentalgiana TaxID=2315210 RepID=A0A2R5GLS7_9STRA|nr:Ribosomal RNA-processing protein 7-like A [Hondaea fermentalgiana]|eukprot:GBG28824.1 Ribosomal RNA-processing protein 7-like A [Hondaea fermentalgiana]
MATTRGLVPLPVLCSVLPAELETWSEQATERADLSSGKKANKKRKRQTCAEFAQTPEGKRLVKYLFIKLHNTGQASTFGAKAGDVSSDEDDDDEEKEEDEGATLFVANVGVAWSQEAVRKVFEAFGEVEAVDLGSSGTTRFARVRFAMKTAALRALERASASSKEGPLDATSAWTTGKDGVEEHNTKSSKAKKPRWMRQYDAERPGTASLKKSSEAYMERFAELEKEIEELRKAQENQADEDGFTMVSYKKGSRARANPTTAVSAKDQAGRRITDGKGKKKSSKGPLTDFYRFQTRDHKKSKLAELRAKFEQDKQQVERLKASRRFHPLS